MTGSPRRTAPLGRVLAVCCGIGGLLWIWLFVVELVVVECLLIVVECLLVVVECLLVFVECLLVVVETTDKVRNGLTTMSVVAENTATAPPPEAPAVTVINVHGALPLAHETALPNVLLSGAEFTAQCVKKRAATYVCTDASESARTT